MHWRRLSTAGWRWSFTPFERAWQDLRHAGRVFARQPGFTAIAVISIAFGTGANVAMFSVADALLLRPLPVHRPDELVTVGSKVRHGVFFHNAASYKDYQDIRDRARSFGGLIAYTHETVGIATEPGDSPRVRIGTFVSANFFVVIGMPPTLGRGFLPADDTPLDPAAVVVLSHDLWMGEYHGDPAVLGRTLRIGGVDFTIVGVAPERFTGLHPYIREFLFVPLSMLPRIADLPRPDALDARDVRILTLKGRLREGVTIHEARSELTAIGRDLERAYPQTNGNVALIAQTELEYVVQQRPIDWALVLILMTLSSAVLAVACANVAGLLASRAPVRAREMALRLAVGASRARLIRQLITESLAIAVTGAAGGLALAHIGIILLRRIQYPSDMIVMPPVELDQRALLFSLAVATISAFLVGLGPALQTTRVDLTTSLKAADRGSTGRRGLTARSALVAAQVVFSLVLMTVAVFSIQVFGRELRAGPGFRTTHMAKATISASQARYTDVEAARFFTQVLEDARALPGVRSASLTSAMPMFTIPFQFAAFVPEGREFPDGQSAVPVWANCIDDRYFETMDIEVLAGRVFTAADDGSAPPVAVVNDTLARHYFPDGDAIGKRLQLLDGNRRLVEIVGVVRTTIYMFPGELPRDGIFFPYRQQPRGQMTLLTHTAGDSAAQLEPMRDLVNRLDPDVPVFDLQTIEAFYDIRAGSPGQVLVNLVGAMGLMGIALTMIGLYGLVAYAVNRRTREIGIRIAVGASYRRIIAMILRQGIVPAWLGLIVGLLFSGTTTRLLERVSPLRYRIGSDTYSVVVPVIFAVTLIAAYIPARRAARVDPTVALRAE